MRAKSGFAYGAIGADIHVFGDGTPLYLLFAHRPAAHVDPEWQRAQPSRMLDARAEVVDFTGRDAELSELASWRGTEPGFRVRWLHGEGGQGKTRLANQLAADAQRSGWLVVDAVHRTDAHPPAKGGQDLRCDEHAGVLLLVDYADRWPVSDLSWLLQNRLLRHPMPTRVLLVARSTHGWPAIRGKIDKLRENIDTSVQKLPPLPSHGDDRTRMFSTARDCFARLYPEASEPSSITPPGSLSRPEFGLTLAVQMAALAAVDAQARGLQPPTDVVGLTTYLLNREHENWRQLHENLAGGLDFQTPDDVMARTVFVANLTGRAERADGRDTLEKLGLELPGGLALDRVLDDHAVCYPTTGVLEPVLPDRLAEDFIALTLPGSPVDGYPSDDWAASSLRALLRRGPDGQPPAWTSRAVSFLAAAAGRWPHVGHGHLYPVLHQDAALAVDAGSGALVALTDLEDADLKVLQAIDSTLDMRLRGNRKIDLEPGAAAFAARLLPHYLAGTDDPAEHASRYASCSSRLAYAGRATEALGAADHAVRLRHQLTVESPKQFAPLLAESLNDQALLLAELGRREKALAAVQRAVQIYMRLTENLPQSYDQESFDALFKLAFYLGTAATMLARAGRRAEALDTAERSVQVYLITDKHLPGSVDALLSSGLHNLSMLLADSGLHSEALAHEERAVSIGEKLARADPAAHGPDLARSLISLSHRLTDLGRRQKALTAAERALQMYRKLHEDSPTAFEKSLFGALDTVASLLSRLGRYAEAADHGDEAVEIAVRLTAAEPGMFEPDLAVMLLNQGNRLSDSGRRQEALAATQRAVEIRERLADREPQAFEPDLASSLHNLGNQLSDLGYRRDALAAVQRAVVIRERLADREPQAFEPDLASSLQSLGNRLTDLGYRQEALAATQRAVEIRERLADREPQAFEPDFASALNSQCISLLEMGRHHEATAHALKSVEIYGRLVESNPHHVRDHAMALGNLGATQFELGDAAGAITSSEQSLRIYRRLAAESPDAFEPQLAEALHNHGALLASAGRREEALEAVEQALEIMTRWVAAEPELFEPILATVLDHLGMRFSDFDRNDEALAVIGRSVEIRRRLAKTDPAKFEPALARSLHNRAARLVLMSRHRDAVAAVEQTIDIQRRLVLATPGVFEPDLARSLWFLGSVLGNEGADLNAALTAVEEAVAIYSSLASAAPDLFDGMLASVRSTRAEIMGALSESEEQVRG